MVQLAISFLKYASVISRDISAFFERLPISETTAAQNFQLRFFLPEMKCQTGAAGEYTLN
jgi:hypothetical protein